MTIELVGVLTFVVGLIVLVRGPDFGIFALMLASLLQAAAAIKLPALGGSSIQPSYVILPFYVIAVAMSRDGISNAMRSILGPTPLFFYGVFVAFAVILTFFTPRLFEGAVDIVSISRENSFKMGIASAHLAPSSGNVTQVVYLTGNLVLFATAAAHAMNGGLATIVKAVLVAAAANLAFAALDLITFTIGSAEYLDVIRNANYRMLVDDSIHGIKRIVGSFSEASTFGGRTVLFFAFCTELWLQGVFRRAAGILALLSLAAVLFSTSSSAYVVLAIYCSLLLLRCVYSGSNGRISRRAFAVAILTPAAGVLLLLLLMLLPSTWSALTGFVDTTLIDKLDSQSGMERSFWNEQGLRVFNETAMMGAGVGSVRSSSLGVALLANTGLIGLILFVLFLLSLVSSAFRCGADPERLAFVSAGGWSSFVVLVSAGFTAPDVALHFVFFVCATIVCSPALLTHSASLNRSGLSSPRGVRHCGDVIRRAGSEFPG